MEELITNYKREDIYDQKRIEELMGHYREILRLTLIKSIAGSKILKTILLPIFTKPSEINALFFKRYPSRINKIMGSTALTAVIRICPKFISILL